MRMLCVEKWPRRGLRQTVLSAGRIIPAWQPLPDRSVGTSSRRAPVALRYLPALTECRRQS